ncbi:hypothetical protein B0J13DRAFT_605024 [Dactylonectria estremocensis]|uniref:Uncharacterized protein n=1 Tax=Dactylonectria estremocensis TaxID=1079267 RepID=A0A9P9F341_9HYPO|nr:hypothetical protein B0J13DRAFT_605024 [Dactylonectria estremocensis]
MRYAHLNHLPQRRTRQPRLMDKATVLPAHPHILKRAAEACTQHDEGTRLETHNTSIIRHYRSTDTHRTIFRLFREQHGRALVGDLEEFYQAEPIVDHKRPFVLFQEGSIPAEAHETLIIIPLGYLQTYLSTPKIATGSTVVDLDGYYEPVLLTLSTLTGKWSILSWKTGTYIRIPPGSQVKVCHQFRYSLGHVGVGLVGVGDDESRQPAYFLGLFRHRALVVTIES